MSEHIVVTVLVENSVQGRGLMAEHGLALHVQAGSDSLLFDTGQSALVVENARQLGVDLSRLRAVALSHGHSDHAGGLRAVWELAPHAHLYAHPAALVPRFARNPDGSTRAVGISDQRGEGLGVQTPQLRHTATPTEDLELLVHPNDLGVSPHSPLRDMSVARYDVCPDEEAAPQRDRSALCVIHHQHHHRREYLLRKFSRRLRGHARECESQESRKDDRAAHKLIRFQPEVLIRFVEGPTWLA